ncbi:MAG: FAD-dependent oxidoreductase, partial [Acidimicrobiia bacterium]|nr:FAD-dependent oxidoreductase [Acidimicrobiia bacterium]
MGSATAWHLARRGRSVALLERFGAGHTRGSSHGGTRIFRLAYVDGVYVHLARAAQRGWRELEEDVGETLLDVTGGVDHGAPESIAALAAALTGAG